MKASLQPSTTTSATAPARVFPLCPHEQIIALYHELLPMARKVRKPQWSGAQSQALASRWLEDPKRQSPVWWASFFQRVAKSDFLTGRVSPRHGGRPFEVDLAWLIAPSNFAGIIAGRYD